MSGDNLKKEFSDLKEFLVKQHESKNEVNSRLIYDVKQQIKDLQISQDKRYDEGRAMGEGIIKRLDTLNGKVVENRNRIIDIEKIQENVVYRVGNVEDRSSTFSNRVWEIIRYVIFTILGAIFITILK